MKMIKWKSTSVRYRIIYHVLNNLSYIYIRGLVCSVMGSVGECGPELEIICML